MTCGVVDVTQVFVCAMLNARSAERIRAHMSLSAWSNGVQRAGHLVPFPMRGAAAAPGNAADLEVKLVDVFEEASHRLLAPAIVQEHEPNVARR